MCRWHGLGRMLRLHVCQREVSKAGLVENLFDRCDQHCRRIRGNPCEEFPNGVGQTNENCAADRSRSNIAPVANYGVVNGVVRGTLNYRISEADLRRNLEAKLDMLEAKGVTVIDRRQTYLDESADVSRICRGAILYPGTRLVGARTFVGPGAKVGIEGPAVLENAIIGENAEVASGYLKEAVMLRDARVGSNAHIRAGTLLEEEASTAHAVGLKHTVLLSFVTMGSLINFCDGLISGGTSRKDHTEVGSGFIHFNFTPRGKSGDKATPSLIGDVPHGVFLRQRRIFLGGLSGIVGPQKVGFGSCTVAGQVLRREVPSNRLVGDVPRKVDKEFYARVEAPHRILKLNLEYIGHLP